MDFPGKDKYLQLANKVKDFLGVERPKVVTPIPEAQYDEQGEPVNDDKMTSWVRALYDEAVQFERDHFLETARHRIPKMGQEAGYDPDTWRDDVDRLEAGNHWQVFGRRNQDDPNKWKQERVDPMISQKMRARKAYITGNWHAVTLTPNIKNMDAIFDQEREKNAWPEWVGELVTTAQKYGIVTNRTFVDTTEDETVVRNMVCQPGKVVRTPYSTSYAKRDGCWYVVHATPINDKQVEEQFPNLDSTQLKQGDRLESNRASRQREIGTYQNTKQFVKFEVFFDDPAIEEIPFGEEQQSELAGELDQLSLGQAVEAKKDQHHKVHIQQKTEALGNLMQLAESKGDTLEPEDHLFGLNVMEAFTQNIEQHMQMMDNDDLASLGLRHKYPNGRYVVVVGETLAADKPNPYNIPWRKLFRDVKNEKVLGRNDGKGDPEILYHNQFTADTALSRFDDIMLATTPKKYRHLADKDNASTSTETDNDPTKVEYFADRPPIFTQAQAPAGYLEAYKLASANADRDLGVNDITIGGEPTNQSSGFQTNLLQNQNKQMVSGELDKNLREALKDIIETMFDLYKEFYTEPRQYFLNGNPEYVNVSDILSFTEVMNQQTGTLERRPLAKIQISIKPFSNHYDQWYIELNELTQVSQMKDPMGMPMFPDAAFALRDHISTKYPEFGNNGKYGKMSQVFGVAMQLIQQQQEMQKQAVDSQNRDQQTLTGVVQDFKRKNLKTGLELMTGAGQQ